MVWFSELKKIDAPIEGRHVIVVEDIVDTGLSMEFILNIMKEHNPASLKAATLLHKAEATRVEVPLEYVGFEIKNLFVIGYGLDLWTAGKKPPGYLCHRRGKLMSGTRPERKEPLYYGDYLHLGKLLNAQELESTKVGETAHDEMLFIIVHQAFELWFKLILWELDAVKGLFEQSVVEEKELGRGVAHLERIVEIQRLFSPHIDILETMTPIDFLEFRDTLFPASGFSKRTMASGRKLDGNASSGSVPIWKNKLFQPAQRNRPSESGGCRIVHLRFLTWLKDGSNERRLFSWETLTFGAHIGLR